MQLGIGAFQAEEGTDTSRAVERFAKERGGLPIFSRSFEIERAIELG